MERQENSFGLSSTLWVSVFSHTNWYDFEPPNSDCNIHAAELAKVVNEIKKANAELVVIGSGTALMAKQFKYYLGHTSPT
jgi:uncharacterized protein (DUF362 family)